MGKVLYNNAFFLSFQIRDSEFELIASGYKCSTSDGNLRLLMLKKGTERRLSKKII